MNTIHGGYASGGDTMVAKRKHAHKAEMVTIEAYNLGYLDQPNTVYIVKDVERLLFPYDDMLIIKETIPNVLTIEYWSTHLMDVIFLSTLRSMGYEEWKLKG